MPHGNKCSGVECVFFLLVFYGVFFVFSFAASLCPQAGEKLFGVTQSRSTYLALLVTKLIRVTTLRYDWLAQEVRQRIYSTTGMSSLCRSWLITVFFYIPQWAPSRLPLDRGGHAEKDTLSPPPSSTYPSTP
jgi:hypothetical protein